MRTGTLRKPKAFAWAEFAGPVKGMGERVTAAAAGFPTPRHCPFTYASVSRSTSQPVPAPAARPAPTPASSGRQPRMRPPAPLPSFPRFTSLPFPPRFQLHRYDWPADLLASSNKRRPLAPVLLGRTKQKQRETGQRRSEAAAEAEERASGQRTRDRSASPGPGRAAAAAAAAAARGVSTGAARTLGSTAPSPQPRLPSDAAARWEGEGAWRPWPGLVRSGSAGLGSGRLLRAPPAPPSVPTPGAVGSPPRSPPSGLGPGARRRGPAPSQTPSPLGPARGAGRRGAPPASRGRRAFISLGEWASGPRFWPD